MASGSEPSEAGSDAAEGAAGEDADNEVVEADAALEKYQATDLWASLRVLLVLSGE